MIFHKFNVEYHPMDIDRKFAKYTLKLGKVDNRNPTMLWINYKSYIVSYVIYNICYINI